MTNVDDMLVDILMMLLDKAKRILDNRDYAHSWLRAIVRSMGLYVVRGAVLIDRPLTEGRARISLSNVH